MNTTPPLPSAGLILALLLIPCATAGAQEASDPTNNPLGRLFFTPEKRTLLERQRQLNIQETQTLEGSTLSLDGVIVRSSGKRTVWINQRVQHDDAAPAGVIADVGARRPDEAVLQTGMEAPTRLKVGETVNRATHEATSGLGQGRIGVHRPPPARPGKPANKP